MYNCICKFTHKIYFVSSEARLLLLNGTFTYSCYFRSKKYYIHIKHTHTHCSGC